MIFFDENKKCQVVTMQDKIKVVIVEDNEDERPYIKDGLTESGLFEVIGEAGDGDELLLLLSARQCPMPQLILCDLNMPRKNGYEVLKALNENASLTKSCVIILSTAPYIPYGERCKKLGASAYFTKPDTFLEYEAFARTLYDTVKKSCD